MIRKTGGMDMSKGRIYQYAAIWTLIGFAAGSLMYLVLRFLFGVDMGFWKISLAAAGYSGCFIGIAGGFIHLCRTDGAGAQEADRNRGP